MTDLIQDDTTDDKYITFRRTEFMEFVTNTATSQAMAEMVERGWTSLALKDAVVIRRQDLFASPCLSTYAQMISMVANNITDPEQAKELLRIADYFNRQGELAAAEGWKLPTL